MHSSVLTHSIVIERSILSLILNSPKYVFEDINNILRNNYDHFHVQAHKDIYKTILSLYSSGKTINQMFLTEKLKATNLYTHETMDALKRIMYISKNKDINQDNYKEAVNVLITNSAKRFIGNKAISLANAMMAEESDPMECYNTFVHESTNFQNKLNEVESDTIHKDVLSALSKIEEDVYNHNNNIDKGTKFGYPAYDDIAQSLKGNTFMCLAGRPGTGKTAFSLSAAINIAMSGKGVLYFSLEMDKTQLYKRAFSYLATVPSKNIVSGDIDYEEIRRIKEASDTLRDIRLFIEDSADCDLFDIRSKIYHYKQKHKIDIVFIDYLQLVKPPKAFSREREIAEISRAIKKYSKEFDIPIVMLAQLNREAANIKPEVFHLRESGAIEQDADLIVLLYEKAKIPETMNVGDNSVVVEVIVGKNRNGRIGSTNLLFMKDYVAYRNPPENTNAIQLENVNSIEEWNYAYADSPF